MQVIHIHENISHYTDSTSNTARNTATSASYTIFETSTAQSSRFTVTVLPVTPTTNSEYGCCNVTVYCKLEFSLIHPDTVMESGVNNTAVLVGILVGGICLIIISPIVFLIFFLDCRW